MIKFKKNNNTTSNSQKNGHNDNCTPRILESFGKNYNKYKKTGYNTCCFILFIIVLLPREWFIQKFAIDNKILKKVCREPSGCREKIFSDLQSLNFAFDFWTVQIYIRICMSYERVTITCRHGEILWKIKELILSRSGVVNFE